MNQIDLTSQITFDRGEAFRSRNQMKEKLKSNDKKNWKNSKIKSDVGRVGIRIEVGYPTLRSGIRLWELG